MKSTLTFMSAKFPISFMVEDTVAEQLFKKVNESGKPSEYVNNLLKWALASEIDPNSPVEKWLKETD